MKYLSDILVDTSFLSKKNEKEYLYISAPGKDRTCDTGIRNPVLYPLSYGGMRCS